MIRDRFLANSRVGRRSALECLTPSAYGLGRGLERFVINIELVPRESTETAEHLEEDLTVEAGVFYDRQLTQMLQPETRLKRGQVDEVARLCPAEHGQHLVDGKLLDAEQEPHCGPIWGKETCVCGDVDARAIIAISDDQACESGGDLHLHHGQPRVADCGLEDPHNMIDCAASVAKKSRSRQTVDLAAGDEGSAAGKHEARRLTQPGEERSHSKLQRAQHARSDRPCRRNHAAHARRT